MKRWLLLAAAVLIAFVAATAAFLFTTARGQDLALGPLANLAMRRAAPPPAFDGLRVFMCGTASPLPAPGRAQACVAVMAGDSLHLVDAGAGSAAVASLAHLPLERLQAILLTHFHSDHIAEISEFNLNSWVAGRTRPLEVVGPPGVETVVDGLNLAYAADRSYRVAHHGEALLPPRLGVMRARTIEPGAPVASGALSIASFAADHGPARPAVGYRFDYRGRSVVVSGDTNATATLAAAARDADLLLHDALSVPTVQALQVAAADAGRDRQTQILGDIQNYHASTLSVLDLARAAGVHTTALYHLVPAPQNAFFNAVFRRGLPNDIVLTEDGMWFELAAGGDAVVVVAP